MTRPGTTQAGFTLLEILVALVVLGFLLLGLAEGVRFGLHAWDSETKLVDRGADMDGAERLLREIVAQADPGQPNEPPTFRGQPRSLEFQTRLPVQAPSLPTREAEVGLGVDAAHRLVLRWAAHPHAERLTKAAKPEESVLLEGLDRIEFKYLRWPDQGGGWTDRWDLPSVPALVRMTLIFPPEDRRHWPAIEAAPMRSRNQQ